jgi:hypothetical protein
MKLRYKYLLSAAPLAALLLIIVGAGWKEDPRRGAVQEPPILSGVIPNEIAAGSPDFTLTVTGRFFAAGSVIRWNGADRATTFVNSDVARAIIPAGDVAVKGTAGVSIANPVFPIEHAGASNVMPFLILPATSY